MLPAAEVAAVRVAAERHRAAQAGLLAQGEVALCGQPHPASSLN
jgi:hypothetical protein